MTIKEVAFLAGRILSTQSKHFK